MIIDGDLQDPPELLMPFYQKLEEGYDVVYAVRKKRKEGVIKRTAYWLFYRFLNAISEVNIPLDSGDFCMMSRRVCDIIVAMPEQSRFIRGMRTWVGFRQFGFEYEREKRASGEPKYTFKALFRLAYDGIFNFSYVPLRVITKLGFYSILASVGYLAYVIYKKLMGYELPSGFTALIFAIILFSGVQLICLGIIGEYLARIYMQVKNRPLFVIKSIISNKQKNG
jgi:glycosyltransferase involved in cell wall biosynthesis